MAEPNVVFVGGKPVMSYVLAVVTQFHSGQPEVVIKARGKAISRAVDAAEIVRNKFMQGAQVKGVRIGTESVVNGDGGRARVSSIEIRLEQPPGPSEAAGVPPPAA